MPTLEEKKAKVEEITETLESSQAIYVTNYSGLSVPEINELRSEFSRDGLTFRVYKNTLIKRAMEDVGGYDDLYPHLHNQNAFAFAEEELAKPAKILKKFNEEHEKPEFKAALIDGGYYGPEQLDTLAAMKSKEEVIGEIVSLLKAPVSNVISALQAQGENLAGAVETIAENADELGTEEETEAAEEESTDEEDESASADEEQEGTATTEEDDEESDESDETKSEEAEAEKEETDAEAEEEDDEEESAEEGEAEEDEDEEEAEEEDEDEDDDEDEDSEDSEDEKD